MSDNCKATQTEPQECLTAVKLRLAELQSLLPEFSDLLATHEPDPNVFPIMPNDIAYGIWKKSNVFIGPNLTSIDMAAFCRIDWKCYTLATRSLLDAVFNKHTLATCNISGLKQGLKGRRWAAENTLDPRKISDIVHLVRKKCNVGEAQIRKIIAIKCSDTKRYLHN